MELELAGKVALVTGGTKGIGSAIAQTLLAEGASVVVGARHVSKGSSRDDLQSFAVDLATAMGPAALVDYALERHGRIDILINNVGVLVPRTDGFLSISDDDFDQSHQLNFMAAVRTTRAVIPSMLANGGGSIVNVASVKAFYQADGLAADYGAAKAALVNLAKSLALEYGPLGIRVNSVSPGTVSTRLWLGENGIAEQVGIATGVGTRGIESQTALDLPTRRVTTAEEVATIVALLASPRTANVTGADYIVDGGLVRTT